MIRRYDQEIPSRGEDQGSCVSNGINFFIQEPNLYFGRSIRVYATILGIMSLPAIVLAVGSKIHFVFYGEADYRVSFVGGPVSTLFLAWMGFFPINLLSITFTSFIFSVWTIIANIVTASQYGDSYTFMNKYLLACSSQGSSVPLQAGNMTELRQLGSKFSGESSFFPAAAVCQFQHYSSSTEDNCFCTYVTANVLNHFVANTESNCTTVNVPYLPCSTLFGGLKNSTHAAFGLSAALAVLVLPFAVLGTVALIYHAYKWYSMRGNGNVENNNSMSHLYNQSDEVNGITNSFALGMRSDAAL